MATCIEQSKRDWKAKGEFGNDTDDLQLGCLQRIANATEAMAKYHVDLIKQRDFWKDSYEGTVEHNASLRKTISNLKGQITKLKNRLEPNP